LISAGLLSTLTTLIGLSLLAGWLTTFRNRGYLAWLGLAFLAVSGYLLASDRAREAHELGLPHSGPLALARACLIVCLIAFVIAIVAAARETGRRMREIRESHQAAEEAMLEMIQASREKEAQAEQSTTQEGDGGGSATGNE
jgi:hypothetical protein